MLLTSLSALCHDNSGKTEYISRLWIMEANNCPAMEDLSGKSGTFPGSVLGKAVIGGVVSARPSFFF